MHSVTGPTWIPVTEAHKLLAACSDRQAALRDLDDLVARGGVKVWATGIVSLYRNQAGSSRQPSGPVQPGIWDAIRSGPLDPAMWATGLVTLPATATATGIVLRGIRLERGAFLRLLDEYPGNQVNVVIDAGEPAPAENREPGGKRKWKEWDRVWSALLKLAQDDRLNRAEFPSQAQLMKEIRDMEGGDDLFSDRILKKFLSPVYKEFVQPRA